MLLPSLSLGTAVGSLGVSCSQRLSFLYFNDTLFQLSSLWSVTEHYILRLYPTSFRPSSFLRDGSLVKYILVGFCSRMSALRTPSFRSLEERRLSRKRKSGSGLRWEPEDEQKEMMSETLPNDRRKLDALMNYHLGELDRLKPFVISLNDDKEQHEVRLVSAKHRADGNFLLTNLSIEESNKSFALQMSA